MSETRSYNFHDLVGFELESRDIYALDFIEEEFRFSAGKFSPGIPVFRLHWRRGNALGQRSSGYSFHSHKLLAQWAYRVNLGESRIEIDAVGNGIAVPMVHHMLVHPSLRFLSSTQSALMLHGAAVVYGDRSLIFTGMGGTGKTTVSSLILERGGAKYRLHADDYVFLLPGRKSLPYLTRSHLYLDLLRWIPQLRSRLSLGERMKLEFYGRLRMISREGVKWPIRLGAQRLWPKHEIAAEAYIAAIILLKRTERSHPSIERISPTDIPVGEVLNMNFFEARHFCRLLEKNLGIPQATDRITAWKAREQELLIERLAETPVYWMGVPYRNKAPADLGDELLRLLEPLYLAVMD